jgi:uncharacterized protein (DUF983 family)
VTREEICLIFLCVVNYSIPKVRTLLWRGCRKKCPQCGDGDLYQGWAKLHEHCPACGLQYLPDQGDLWGLLLFLDRALFIIPLIVLIYFRLADPSLTRLFVFGGVLIFLLIFTLPHRNGISLGIDYQIRRKCGDLAEKDSPEQP